MARQQPLWSRAALVVALGVLGSGACWFSASAATNVTASQLASGSSGVQGCTGSAHAAWTPNPIATASGTAITGGTLTALRISGGFDLGEEIPAGCEIGDQVPVGFARVEQ